MTDPLDDAARVLTDAGDVTLVCHVNPDADALGSMLGLANYLAGRGVKVAAAVPNPPGDLPRWAEVLPGLKHLVPPGEVPAKPKILVTLDAADIRRLDGLGHLVDRSETVVCIDHHRTNPGFGTVNLIDANASATAEIVFRLIERMGGQLDADVAACLYAGLVSDTGRFQYESASPEVLRIAARLRELPFDHVRLALALYADASVPYLRLLGMILGRVRHVPEANLVWVSVTRADLEAAGVPIQETDELIDILRTAREADVAAVLKEQRDGKFKVSLRSRGDTDVAAIAEAFDGGGHRLAAGYTASASLDDSVRVLVDALVAASPATAAP
ncbi:MAG TPA: bifunctional oligoribonuclease/PAP phosphatase NrnA [Actinomycetota bacterium]|nr:bifunctional oligoribonuclease/PAP phosphatase NrnA [Actinomycetota bacterium]